MTTRAASDGLPGRLGGNLTVEKLQYVRKYTSAFMTAMGPTRDDGKWARLIYIDPLCGPGLDIDSRSGAELRGSPLIAVDTRPQFDRLFLGDVDPGNIIALRHRIGATDIGRCSIVPRDCHDRVREVVEAMSPRDLGLAFIDPESFEVRFQLFETLAERAVDILFLFPTGAIVANAREFVASVACDLDDLWGGRQWRDLPIALASSASLAAIYEADEHVHGSWARAFCERVSTLGYRWFDSVGPLRNEQRLPRFHLLCFSKHETGRTVWRSIGRIEPSGSRQL